jgi:transposase
MTATAGPAALRGQLIERFARKLDKYLPESGELRPWTISEIELALLADMTELARDVIESRIDVDSARAPDEVLADDGANRHDMKLARETLASITLERPKTTKRKPQGLCLDKGYDYDEVREIVREFAFTAHIRSRGEEAKAFKRKAAHKARRWVVELTHSWLNRFRRMLVRWEKLPESHIAMLHLAFGIITWRATALLEWAPSAAAHVGRLAPDRHAV